MLGKPGQHSRSRDHLEFHHVQSHTMASTSTPIPHSRAACAVDYITRRCRPVLHLVNPARKDMAWFWISSYGRSNRPRFHRYGDGHRLGSERKSRLRLARKFSAVQLRHLLIRVYVVASLQPNYPTLVPPDIHVYPTPNIENNYHKYLKGRPKLDPAVQALYHLPTKSSLKKPNK
jgi:hypothetical protein